MGSNYDKRKYEIIAKYASIGENVSVSGEICPACEGGATKEGSLSVSRRGGALLWCCHRASCNFRGSDRVASEGGSQLRESGSGSPDVTVHPLNKADARLLATKLGIPIESVEFAGIGWTGDGDGRYSRRFSFPIFDSLSRVRGTTYRSYEGAKPKAITTLAESGAVGACWYRWRRQSDNLVLVEDQVSAIKLAPYVDALALLGINLSEAKVEEILAVRPEYKVVHFSLDPDAVGEAIKTQLRLVRKGVLPNLRLTAIERDVKNMDKEQFDTYLRRVV